MNIRDLPIDCIKIIALYSPKRLLVHLSECDKKLYSLMAVVIQENSIVLTDFLQGVYNKSQTGEEVDRYFKRFSGSTATTPYAFRLDATEPYKEEVMQQVAKVFPNLVHCSYTQFDFMEPNAGFCGTINRKLRWGAICALGGCTLPFYAYNTFLEGTEENTIAHSLAHWFVGHVLNFGCQISLLDNRSLSSLSELFSSTLKELDISIRARKSFSSWDVPLCTLPYFENIEAISIRGEKSVTHSEMSSSWSHNPDLMMFNTSHVFTQYKHLTALSIHKKILMGIGSLDQVVKESFLPTLKHLCVGKIEVSRTFLIQHEAVLAQNELLSSILSHCKELSSLRIAKKTMTALFSSIPQEPYTPLVKLEINDQTEGGENLFRLFPNLSEVVIHEWKSTSSITFSSPPFTLRKVTFVFKRTSKKENILYYNFVKNRMMGKGFEIEFIQRTPTKTRPVLELD